jgi:hypothetical protein
MGKRERARNIGEREEGEKKRLFVCAVAGDVFEASAGVPITGREEMFK